MSRNRKLLALALAMAGATALQACSVTTGGFAASRSPMRSQYDMLHSSYASPVHSMMSTTHEPSLKEYKYY